MQLDWGSLSMKFQVAKSAITLQGDHSLSKSLVSMKSMLEAFQENGERILLELGSISEKLNEVRVDVPKELKAWLIEFDIVLLWTHVGYLYSEKGIVQSLYK